MAYNILYFLVIFFFGINFCFGFRTSDEQLLRNSHTSEMDLEGFFREFNNKSGLEEYSITDESTVVSYELTATFIRSMDICQEKLNEASKKLERILDHYSEINISENLSKDGEENGDTDDDRVLDIVDAKLDPLFEKFGKGIEQVQEEIAIGTQEELATETLKGRRNTTPKYVKDLEKVLHTFNHACNSLPNALPAINSRHPRNPKTMMERLVHSLTKWTERWMNSVETKFDSFIDNCLTSPHCKKYLEKVVQNLVEVLKSQKNAFGEASTNVLQELLQELSFKGSPSMETLTHLERLALGFGGSFDEYNKQEEDAFDMANGISSDIIGNSPWIENPQHHQIDNELASAYFKLQFKKRQPSKNAELEVETSSLVTNVPETFLSLTFDSRLVEKHWKGIQTNFAKFLNLASSFTPSILRVGGSAANFLTFDPLENENVDQGTETKENHPKFKASSKKGTKSSNQNELLSDNFISATLNHPKRTQKHKKQITLHSHQLDFTQTQSKRIHDYCDPHYQTRELSNFTMSGKDWNFLTSLAEKLNWTLLFDLNQFWRDPEGNWDPSNAKLLIKDAQTKNVSIIWQLGNEPNAYEHNYDWSISPQQAAKDFKLLKAELPVTGQLINLVGPDVTRPRHVLLPGNEILDEEVGVDSVEFLTKFLKDAGDVLDAVSWHQYFFDGRTATLDNFISSEIMNLFPRQLKKIALLRDELATGKPVWITETASAWGGGAPGLSNRFAGGFPWLDKLGAAAQGGASQVFRQSLYGGCYALIDPDLNPYPDFWVSLLHKRLVGQGVLLPRVRLAPDSLRIYAHCLNSKHELYKKGAVVVFAMNLSGKPLFLDLVNKEFKESKKYRYELTPPHGDLTSRHTLLNGKLLELSTDDNLPQLIPVEEDIKAIDFAPWATSFWVFPDVAASVC